ncbi:major centromere autoantigen B [Chelonia mydas]|uniref:major centromere autoantigen B n=1 Tax=Chelonia mydas TaxID=8469 RepID=UPI0018A1CBE5|nr:major centromere autoantigen B [Chelonia mydas]
MPRSLSLKEKAQIVRECQRPGATQSQVAAKWELHRSVVCRIWQQKEKLLADYEAGQSNGCRKRGREGKAPAVDRALFTWLKEKRAQGARLAGPAVKEKARQLAASLGLNDFKASDGWFTRWKKRFNVACKKEQGGNQSAGKPASEQWQCENLPHILEKFSPADVYIADETGLYLKGLCDRGHGENNEKLEGGKAAKDRVTVLVCANMDGSDKRPLFMIGKLKRPRCFPEDFRKLPLNYVSSANAWMTGEIFINWLKKRDRQLCWQSRKICLFLANCSIHPQGVVLTNIQLEFLPPNATSLLQPMAQGVIENMKGHYRSKIANRINVALDVDPNADVQTVLKTVNLLDCVHLVAEAWRDVKPTTISNCFRKGKFVVPEEGGRDEDIAESDDPLTDVPLPVNMEKGDLVAAVAVDEDLLTFRELSDEELLGITARCSKARETRLC